MIEFCVLGPLTITQAGCRIVLTSTMLRRLLAILLAHADQVLPIDTISEELWFGKPPQTARKTVQVYVHRLRHILGDTRYVEYGPAGYTLRTTAARLDSKVFDQLVADAMAAKAREDLQTASSLAKRSLELWHGPAYVDFQDLVSVSAESGRLEDKRLSILEERVQFDLDLGRHTELIDELTLAVKAHPFREQLHSHLMVALYRAGRQADALESYRRMQKRLADELGIEPVPELQALHLRILRGDPALRAPAPIAVQGKPFPRYLPPDLPDFVGRGSEIKWLNSVAASPTRAALISAIAGPGGVGKTALAVHWAHRSTDRFPDGQLYVNLRGFGPGEPMAPMDALAQLLTALSIAPEKVPHTEEEASGLLRSTVAGKKLLILLDNAQTADQVRPLLPACPGSLVIVTSRNRLGGLVAREGAQRLTLDMLTEQEAIELLNRILGSNRVAKQPDAAAGLAKACGHLPLALRIAAANLLDHPDQTLESYAKRLMSSDRLAELEVDGDPHHAVRAVFSYSYEDLSAEQRRIFRLIGLLPGPDFTAEHMAALADVSLGAAEESLRQLTAMHLVDCGPTGRFACHDLLRLFARQQLEAQVEQTERAAMDRFHRHYLVRVDAAARLLYAQMLRLPMPFAAEQRFADQGEATAWLDSEKTNLVATIEQAADHGFEETAALLADALRGYLWLRMDTPNWINIGDYAVRASRKSGNRQGLVSAKISLAQANHCTGRYANAVRLYEETLPLSREIGWLQAEGAALGNLATVHMALGQITLTIGLLERSIEIYQRLDHPAGQAVSQGNLGLAYLLSGQLSEAYTTLTQATALHRQHDNRGMLVNSIAHLGEACRQLGRVTEAEAHLTEAAEVSQQIGKRAGETIAAHYRAALELDLGNLAAAREHAQHALITGQVENSDLVPAYALAIIGGIHLEEGAFSEAIERFSEALQMARRGGEPHREAMALVGLAHAHLHSRRIQDALAAAQEALSIASERQFRVLEGDARTILAQLHHHQGVPTKAHQEIDHALDIHRANGAKWSEARALVVASGIFDSPAADRYRAEADVILAELRAFPATTLPPAPLPR